MKKGRKMSLITCENLSFAYEGVTVLQNLNFKVEQGDYLCILGENGAGKSTLMKGLLEGDRLPAPADARAEGFSCQRAGSRPVGVPVRHGTPPLLRQGGKRESGKEHGIAGDH